MRVELRQSPFDPYAEAAAFQRGLKAGSWGATAVFVGSMRDFNLGVGVERMFLEHYPGMTEDHLDRIAEQARKRWSLVDLLLLHRVGEVALGEAIVLTAAWAEHRVDAFAACRFMIEDLKLRAPFWKKEFTAQGQRWVEPATPERERDVAVKAGGQE